MLTSRLNKVHQSRVDQITSTPNSTKLSTFYSLATVFLTIMNDSQFKDFETQPIDFDPVLHAPPRFEPPKPPEPS